MSFLAVPKNKKGYWITLSIIGIAVILFALTARADIIYTNTIFDVPPSIDTLGGTIFYGDNPASNSYQRIAQRLVVAQNHKLCAVQQKIESTAYRVSGNYPFDSFPKVEMDIEKPTWNYYDNSHAPFYLRIFMNTSEYWALTSASGSYANYFQMNTIPKENGWNGANGCVELLGGHTYWFEWYILIGGYPSDRGHTSFNIWYSSPYPAGQLTSWGLPFNPVASTAYEQIPSGNFSFALLDDGSGGISGLAPPATESYNFENRDFGAIGNFFRDVIVYPFVPDSNTLGQYGTLFDTIKSKPPIGYFTAITGELGGIAIGSPSIAFDTTAAAGVITPLRTGLIVILWVLFAFWIFHRLRNLDL